MCVCLLYKLNWSPLDTNQTTKCALWEFRHYMPCQQLPAIYGGRMGTLHLCVCEQTAIGVATDMWHIIMNTQVSGHFIVQLIQQSTTDVCVHLSVMSLLVVDCNCWGQTKVSGNLCHPAVGRGLYMGICGTLLTGQNRSARSKTCPSTTSSTINTTWTALGLNWSLCSD